MGPALLSLAFALALTVLASLLVRRAAPALGLIALRPVRLDGSAVVPTSGGLAIVLVIVSVPALGALLGLWPVPPLTDPLLVVLFGTIAAALVGLVDDAWALGPARKLTAQAAIACGVYLAGVRLTEIELPFVGPLEVTPVVALVGTVAWLVLVMNAFNLTDGADGVAAGIAAVAASALLFHSVAAGRAELSLILSLTLVALLAFLWFNFPPASMILGDAGSLSVGFLLGGLALIGGSPGEGGVGLMAATVIFGIPLLDTGLTIVRRVLSRAAIMRADEGHLHHRLVELGLTPRKVALTMYAASSTLAAAGIIIARSHDMVGLLILVTVALLAGLAVRRLRLPEFVEAARLLAGVRDRRDQISRNVRVVRQVGHLRSAANLDDVQHRLERALEVLGFDQAEIWLASPWPDQEKATATRGWEPSGSGSRWRWDRLAASVLPLERCWELKLPILDEGRRQVGRLTLRRSLADVGAVEIRVLADELLPALSGALGRLETLEVERVMEGERWAG